MFLTFCNSCPGILGIAWTQLYLHTVNKYFMLVHKPNHYDLVQISGSSCDEQKMVLHGVYLACIALLLLVIMILLVILWRMRRRPGEQDEHCM